MQLAIWHDILQTVRWYPSPHNSQPIRVRITNPYRAELSYDLDRGLPAEPYGVPFGFVCAGIFVELVAIAAHGLGFHVDERLRDDDMDFAAAHRLHPLGVLTLTPARRPVVDLDPALISERRTSRLPYQPRVVDPSVLDRLEVEARRWGHRLTTTADQGLVDAVIRINQRTLFDDIANDAVRRELSLWLRYSRKEAERRSDGLSAECLHMPGPVLRWFIRHHTWWSQRGLSDLARWLYLRSMRGVGQLAWLTGPFATNADYLRAGRLFIRLWLLLTEHGVAMHPFGSVITNPRAHHAFCEAAGETETGGMTWMLARIGYSAPPPRSHRLPASALLLEEAA